MFGNPKKRSRLEVWKQQTRLARLGSPDERSARLRSLLARLGLGLLTVLAITLIAHAGGGSWGPPFAFREGETYSRDIRVKTDFTVVDEPLTQLKREQAASAVLPVLRLDPAPLKKLQHHLTQLVLAARARSNEHLDPETISFWSLTDNELRDLGEVLRGEPVDVIGSPLGFLYWTPQPLPGLPEQLLGAVANSRARYFIKDDNDLRGRVEAAFTALLAFGILDDQELESQEALKGKDKFTIVRPGEDNLTKDPTQILKTKLIGDPHGNRGPLHTQFLNAFKNEEMALRLYLLVVGSDKRPSRLPATLKFDPVASQLALQEAIRSVPDQKKEYKRGAPLIEQGRPIKEEDIPLLREEHKAYLASLTWSDHLRRWFSLFVVVAMLGCFVGFHIWQTVPSLAQDFLRLATVCGLVTLALGLAIFFNQAPWYGIIIPLTMTAMILRLAYTQAFAWITSFSMALIITLSLGSDLTRHFLVLVSGTTIAVLLLRSVRTRSQLATVGLAAGLAYALMTMAVGLLTDQSWSLIGADAARRFFWGLIAGLFLTGLLPLIERAFGIVTDMSLLELADVSHPLLQELIRRAPGTYTHSMTVALLSEAAAKAIGANPLLTRVGASYHDIGKMLKPHYFVENQTGENRHEGLAPAMSTLIIIGHVKDGIELAKQHRLPHPIVEFIQQHHGTTLVEYFYQEALRNQESGNGNGELEASFRYPGPKPQTKEIGVVMLADAVEGASRALSEPAPNTLKKLVHEILLKRLLDGQFDESTLTLSELRIIEESLCINLIALYHARVKYPESKSEVKSAV